MSDSSATDRGDERIAALHRLDLLDAPPAEAFDRLTRLVVKLLGVPAAFITLLDEDRDFYLSQCGFGEPLASSRELTGETFCHHLLARDTPLVIDDTQTDPLYSRVPTVRTLGVSAYLGVPLRTRSGVTIGSLCAIDIEPRHWTADDVTLVSDLAAAASTEIQLREAMRAAQEERQRYGDIVDSLDAVVWEADAATLRFTYLSGGVDRILGYTAEEWLAEPDFWQKRVVHPDDMARTVAFFEEAARAGRDHDIEYRALTSSGAVVWLHERVRVAEAADGQRARLRGVMIDVTARKEMTRELEESREEFDQITALVPQVFWIFTPDFATTIYVSPAYEDVWGRPLGDVYRSPADFIAGVHPDDLPRLSEAMSYVSEAPHPAVEYRVVRPDGSIRWVRSQGYPVRDEQGVPYRVVGTTEDITERKAMEAEQRTAEAKYRRLVENAPYAIYALDRDSRFTEVNPAAREMLGLAHGKLLGRHINEVIAPESQQAAADSARRKLVGEAETTDVRLCLLHASGDRRLVHVRATAIRDGDEIIGTQGIARDITEEVETERQLRRAERLASVGTVIGGVAHELNNPLTSIISFAALLAEGHRTPEEREDLETIRREGMRAAKIVSDLRLLARQTQEEPAEKHPVDLNDVVSHVLKTRRYVLDTRNIEVREDLAGNLPLVFGDRSKLEQVLLNLVVNAEHAMENVEAPRRLILRTRRSADGVLLAVVDSGEGIGADDLERIFDPFFTTKAPAQGTGLGLSLVHRIVHEHGGRITVESQPGSGTAFRVELPGANGRGGASEEHAAESHAERSLRILVVDDEPAIRHAFTRYLTKRGHEVDTASEGGEALRLVENGASYDVIVTDLRMPGISGAELLQRLRVIDGGIDRRVIFLTGDAASSESTRILEETGVPVLYKPISLPSLAQHVEALAALSTSDASSGA